MLRYLGIDERLAPPPGSYLSYIYQETVFGPRPLLMDDGVLEATRGSVRLFLEGNDGRETSRRVLGDDVAQRSEWPMDSGAATVTTRAGQD
jgi:hypothetical protein